LLWCAWEAHHIKLATESPAGARSGPSLLRYSPALVLVVIAIADLQRWADPDLWGHVAFGRAMLATRHLTFHDPYSYSAPGHLWLNHEWLSELLMGAIYNLGGVIGLKLMKFTCCAVVIISLALGLAEADSPIKLQLGLLVAASVAIAPQMQFRPQLFTFVMMSALLAILARHTYRGLAALWLAIPMFALWANLHGGFVVGLATLGIFSTVVLIQDLLEGRRPKRGLTMCAIFIASTLVTLATPYGIGAWQAVAHSMTNPRTREVIDDWQPLLSAMIAMWHRNHAGAIPMIAAVAMFVAFAMSFAMNPRFGDLPMVAIAAVMIVAAFIAMRNLPLAVFAIVMPLSRQSSQVDPERPVARQSWLNQIIVGIAAIAVLMGSGLLSAALRAGSSKPVGAIAFMQEHRLSGNIFTDFAWGEYLIWHMAPASKVFIDGRYDTVYPPNVIDDYLAFQYGAKDVLRKYPHDFVLLNPNDEAALAVMASAHEWNRIYRDGSCILFARADSEAGRIVAVDVPSQLTSDSYFP